jgi:hypothetical protein
MPDVPSDSRVEKWTRWLEERIRSEVITMHWHRAVYREVGEIVRENANLPPSGFFTFLASAYGTTQAVAVRRQGEVNPRVVSLGTLLDEVANDPVRLTREWYLSMRDADDARHASRDFDYWAGEDGEHVQPERVRADLATLETAVRPIRGYVDQHLAHSDQRPRPDLPTFDALHSAIDTLGGVFNKYSGLIRASSWATLEPVAQDDWLGIFRVPWIPEGAWRGLPPIGPPPTEV